MNKILVLYSVLFSCLVLGQDTIVNNKVVFIFNEKSKSQICYFFKKRKENKHGRSTKIYFGGRGKIIIHEQYRNNTLHGVYEEYDDSIIRVKSKFHHGILNGVFCEYVDGEIIKKISYRKGLRRGKSYYYNEGHLISKGKYSSKYITKNRNENNDYVFEFSDGRKYLIGKMDQISFDSLMNKYDIFFPYNKTWLRKGVWKYYTKEGKLAARMKYNNKGILIEKKIFIKNAVDETIW